jgi:hypothetical protein
MGGSGRRLARGPGRSPARCLRVFADYWLCSWGTGQMSPVSSRAEARGSEVLQDQDLLSMPDLQDLLPSCPN